MAGPWYWPPVQPCRTDTHLLNRGRAGILGEGQQFVASGIHPDTGKKYVWPGDNLTDIAPEKLTEVTPDDIQLVGPP